MIKLRVGEQYRMIGIRPGLSEAIEEGSVIKITEDSGSGYKYIVVSGHVRGGYIGKESDYNCYCIPVGLGGRLLPDLQIGDWLIYSKTSHKAFRVDADTYSLLGADITHDSYATKGLRYACYNEIMESKSNPEIEWKAYDVAVRHDGVMDRVVEVQNNTLRMLGDPNHQARNLFRKPTQFENEAFNNGCNSVKRYKDKIEAQAREKFPSPASFKTTAGGNSYFDIEYTKLEWFGNDLTIGSGYGYLWQGGKWATKLESKKKPTEPIIGYWYILSLGNDKYIGRLSENTSIGPKSDKWMIFNVTNSISSTWVTNNGWFGKVEREATYDEVQERGGYRETKTDNPTIGAFYHASIYENKYLIRLDEITKDGKYDSHKWLYVGGTGIKTTGKWETNLGRFSTIDRLASYQEILDAGGYGEEVKIQLNRADIVSEARRRYPTGSIVQSIESSVRGTINWEAMPDYKHQAVKWADVNWDRLYLGMHEKLGDTRICVYDNGKWAATINRVQDSRDIELSIDRTVGIQPEKYVGKKFNEWEYQSKPMNTKMIIPKKNYPKEPIGVRINFFKQ